MCVCVGAGGCECSLTRSMECSQTEAEELRAQKLRDEIERKEAELFPEPQEKEALETDACDAFSKEMIKNGLKHTTQSGSHIQIKHDMLPPELDFGFVALLGPTRPPDTPAAMRAACLTVRANIPVPVCPFDGCKVDR